MNFNNTDIVIVNSYDQDFPLFRSFLIKNHRYFNKIHYVISYNSNIKKYDLENYSKYDYTQTVIDSMPFANFIWADQEEIIKWRSDERISDFRDHATNLGIDASTSDSILFLEPDILIGNIDYLLNLPDDLDMIAHCEDSSFRLSPSLIWTKRQLINKTLRWFIATGLPLFDNMVKFKEGPDYVNDDGIVVLNEKPVRERYTVNNNMQAADHFDKFSSEIVLQANNIHLINHRSFDFWHLGGIIYAMNHFRENRYLGSYDLNHAKTYFEKCLKSDAPMSETYIKEITHHLNNISKYIY